jgi:hypothetical protein
MKILALILHTHLQKERYDTIVSTWGQNIDYLFYSDKEDLNTIKVTDRSDYRSAEIKQVNIINNLPDHFMEYDWYLFCDNDTFVNTKLLFEKIETFDPDIIYGEVIQSWPNDFSLKYLSGGAGFLMSYKILSKIKGKLIPYNSGFSDVTLGLYFRDNELQIENSDYFVSQLPEFFNITKIENHITFHYVTSFFRMNEFYQRCKTND